MRPEGLERVLQRTMLRARVQRALQAGALTGGAAWLGLSGAALAGRSALLAGPNAWLLWLLASLPLLAALLRGLSRVDRGAAARHIDRAHDLHDTIQAALEVSARPVSQRSAFAAALLRQAEELAPTLSPRRALPLGTPRGGLLAAAAGALALLLWLLPAARPAPAARPGTARPASLAARPQHDAQRDDLARELEQADADPQQRAILRSFQAGEISRAQAITALLALERKLRHAAAEQLLRGELLERVAALFQPAPGRTPRARTLEQAAEQLRAPSTPEQRAEQQRLLEEKRRELDKLRREHAANAAERRELEQLSRQVNEAQKELGDGRPEQAAAQLDAASQRVRAQQQSRERSAQQQASADRAAQVREQLQRQRENARSAPSQGLAERPRENERGAPGRGAERRENERGAPGQGAERRRENEQRFAERAERGGQLVEAPASGGAGDHSAPSPEPSLFERTARPRVNLEDHAAQSAQGDGPSRSEVVLSAADRGFADESYRTVYADYRQHAEAVLEQDRVPSGYRYYVRRYFQLIRPRTGAPP